MTLALFLDCYSWFPWKSEENTEQNSPYPNKGWFWTLGEEEDIRINIFGKEEWSRRLLCLKIWIWKNRIYNSFALVWLIIFPLYAERILFPLTSSEQPAIPIIGEEEVILIIISVSKLITINNNNHIKFQSAHNYIEAVKEPPSTELVSTQIAIDLESMRINWETWRWRSGEARRR